MILTSVRIDKIRHLDKHGDLHLYQYIDGYKGFPLLNNQLYFIKFTNTVKFYHIVAK